MAVESCLKRDMEGDFDDSDEDMPLRFKRSAQSSRPSQVSPEVKKSSSQPQRRDGQSGAAREASNLHSPHNGLSSSSNPQKGKVAPPAKPSSMRSPLASPKASNLSGKASPVVSSKTEKQGTSVLSGKISPVVNSKTQKQGTSVLSGKVSPMRSSVPNSKASTSVASTSVKVKVESLKRPRQSNSDDEDSDDDKPLGTKIKVNSKWSPPPPQSKTSVKKSPDDSDDEDSFDDTPLSAKIKMNSRLSPRPPQPKTNVKNSPDDSDDEKPLKSKYPLKSSAGSSGTKPSDCDDKKPLATKLQQNGSAGRDNQGKSSTVPGKRPVEKPNPSSQLLASKKPKLSGTSLPAKVKEVTVKAETKKPVKLDNVSSTKSNTSKPASSSKAQEKASKDSKYSKSTNVPPSSGDGQKKWTTLAHNGVIFPPPYQPHGVKILYRRKPIDLTPEQEEVATMYAMMIDTDYMQKEKFKENFWEDWRKILGRKHVIQSLEDCDFTPIYDWYQKEKEKKKQMSSEEKKILKEEKFKQEEKYMWAVVDGVKEKVGNFRVEPPGLFRGRGEHPKMGKLKRRIHPSDITINIGKDAPVPECPIPGENWKEIRNDNTVTWLAFWNDPINPKEFKYVFLAASSSLKGQSDKEKYEKARLLKGYIENIRTAYTKAFTSKDVTKQQIAVATYLIDKLALRAGNEKDDDEADTVGCCTLKIENVTALPQSNKLEFNFLGKDSIKYENVVEVEPLVYKAILQFQTGKKEGDDLFDQLDTSKLNAHLKELMPGLTAKVFRTYNASITLDKMLYSETKDGDVPEKVAVYNYANKQVAIICNHQRSISKSHATQMTKLEEKLNDLKGNLKELRTDLDRAKKGKPPLRDADGKQKRNLSPEALEKKIAQINVKIEKTERDMKTKEDLKTVALGTSKINYLDPRITVAWCKRHEVPIEKMFTKSLLAKFSWAMDVEPDFRF